MTQGSGSAFDAHLLSERVSDVGRDDGVVHGGVGIGFAVAGRVRFEPEAHEVHFDLVREAGERMPLLVDQGDADEFLPTQLKPELLQAACDHAGHPLRLRLQPGYDHSYYFIASFIGEHIAYHARAGELSDGARGRLPRSD